MGAAHSQLPPTSQQQLPIGPGFPTPGQKIAGISSIVGLVVLTLLIILILYAIFSSKRGMSFGRRRR